MASKKKKKHGDKKQRQKDPVTSSTSSVSTEKAVGKKVDDIAPVLTRLTNFLENREKLVVLGLFVLGFALRLWNVFEMRAGDPFYAIPSVDPAVYYDWATRIAAGEGAEEGVFFLSPLYPYFMGAIFWIFGPGFTAARIVQAVLGGLNCVLLYGIGKKTFNIRVGFAAGLLQALYAVSIFYEGVFLITALQTPLNLAMILVLVWNGDRLTVKQVVLAGALLGLSTIARPNVLLFGVLASAFIVLGLKKHFSLPQRFLRAAIFCTVAGLFVLPVTWRNYHVGDDFVLVSAQGGANFYIGNGPEACGYFQVPPIFSTTQADDPLQQRQAYNDYAEEKMGRKLKPSEVSDFWYEQSYEHIASDPGKWIGVLAKKAALFFNHVEIYNSRDFESSRLFSRVLSLPLPTFGFIAPFAILGLLAGLTVFRRAYYLYAMVATYLATALIFFVLAHYRLPVVGILIVFAAFALDYAFRMIHQRNLKILMAVFVILLASTSFVHMNLTESLTKFAVHFNLANKYRELKIFDQAVSEYKKALELRPSYISAANNLATTYALMHNKKAAVEQWKKVKAMAERRGDKKYIDRANRNLKGLSKIKDSD